MIYWRIKMDAKEFVDSLFEGYEKTDALDDFKEELLGNLNAKIENLIRKGMDSGAAFAKASAELGDVSALADKLSQKKRKEVFEEAYMDIRQYMTPSRVIAYVIFGVLALFGIAIGIITFFITTKIDWLNRNFIDMTGFFSIIMPFITASVIGFTYLGVTQETSSSYPMNKKRGAGYATAAGMIAFGIFTMPIMFFSIKMADRFTGDFLSGILGGNPEIFITLISIIIPFVLPGIGILVFLGLTEKNRLKPWAKDFQNKTMQQEMAIWHNSESAARFGLISGAIWIFAVGIFILLGFTISFKYSWLAFVFATAIQCLVQGNMFKRPGKQD